MITILTLASLFGSVRAHYDNGTQQANAEKTALSDDSLSGIASKSFNSLLEGYYDNKTNLKKESSALKHSDFPTVETSIVPESDNFTNRGKSVPSSNHIPSINSSPIINYHDNQTPSLNTGTSIVRESDHFIDSKNSISSPLNQVINDNSSAEKANNQAIAMLTAEMFRTMNTENREGIDSDNSSSAAEMYQSWFGDAVSTAVGEALVADKSHNTTA